MPRGERSSYDRRHRREARPFETSDAKHGAFSKRAERVAWAANHKPNDGEKKSH